MLDLVIQACNHRPRWPGSIGWQFYGNNRPLAFGAAHIDGSIVVANDLIHDRKAKSGPSCCGVRKRLEKLFYLLRRHPFSGVGKNYSDPVLRDTLDRYGKFTAVRHCLYRISCEIPEDLLYLGRITHNSDRLFRQFREDLVLFAYFGTMSKELYCFPDGLGNVCFDKVTCLGTGIA